MVAAHASVNPVVISVLVVNFLLVGFDELRAVLYGVTSWICALRRAGLDLGLDPCFQISVKGEWCLTQKRGPPQLGPCLSSVQA